MCQVLGCLTACIAPHTSSGVRHCSQFRRAYALLLLLVLACTDSACVQKSKLVTLDLVYSLECCALNGLRPLGVYCLAVMFGAFRVHVS